MFLYFVTLLAASAVMAGPTYRRGSREVGGTVSRNFPGLEHQSNRNNREVDGTITRSFPGINGINFANGKILHSKPNRRAVEEMWRVIQTDEENLTMDTIRGKDVPLSLTEDFRGLQPVLPFERNYNGVLF